MGDDYPLDDDLSLEQLEVLDGKDGELEELVGIVAYGYRPRPMFSSLSPIT